MQGFRSSTKQEDMVKFATAGNKPVQSISWPMDHETKNHKNYMFVKYEDRRDAYKALKQDDQKKVRVIHGLMKSRFLLIVFVHRLMVNSLELKSPIINERKKRLSIYEQNS